ncbi:hypothetical protein TNCV_1178251 [Trichonephila clavipes]|nr:hypothetical protein TNCV_1178251 [Trichonephila clavipes]
MIVLCILCSKTFFCYGLKEYYVAAVANGYGQDLVTRGVMTSSPSATEDPPCRGAARGVGIYRPFGNFTELIRTVTRMALKTNDRRTYSPCHDEFRGPRSDYDRQVALETTTTYQPLNLMCINVFTGFRTRSHDSTKTMLVTDLQA